MNPLGNIALLLLELMPLCFLACLLCALLQKMLEYNEYRQLTPEQKIALLEQGECPAGVWDFLCPFWWNHWKVRGQGPRLAWLPRQCAGSAVRPACPLPLSLAD